MKKVIFCHGKEGSPNGTKATMVRDNFDGIIPQLTNSYELIDFLNDLVVVEELASDAEVLVGSSRGGALVCQARPKVRKVLIAPAWKMFGANPILTRHDVILHCKADDRVPYEDSVFLANMFGCQLIECGIDHRMSCEDAITEIKKQIKGNK
jgi:hypothetical protein